MAAMPGDLAPLDETADAATVAAYFAVLDVPDSDELAAVVVALELEPADYLDAEDFPDVPYLLALRADAARDKFKV